MKIEKEHRKSTLMSWTKERLTEHIMCLEYNNNVLHDTIDTQAANCKKLLEKEWIPVDERLPEDGTYICTMEGELCGLDKPFTSMCGFYDGEWDEPGCVFAWMPLPEPYKREIKP